MATALIWFLCVQLLAVAPVLFSGAATTTPAPFVTVGGPPGTGCDAIVTVAQTYFVMVCDNAWAATSASSVSLSVISQSLGWQFLSFSQTHSSGKSWAGHSMVVVLGNFPPPQADVMVFVAGATLAGGTEVWGSDVSLGSFTAAIATGAAPTLEPLVTGLPSRTGGTAVACGTPAGGGARRYILLFGGSLDTTLDLLSYEGSWSKDVGLPIASTATTTWAGCRATGAVDGARAYFVCTGDAQVSRMDVDVTARTAIAATLPANSFLPSGWTSTFAPGFAAFDQLVAIVYTSDGGVGTSIAFATAESKNFDSKNWVVATQLITNSNPLTCRLLAALSGMLLCVGSSDVHVTMIAPLNARVLHRWTHINGVSVEASVGPSWGSSYTLMMSRDALCTQPVSNVVSVPASGQSSVTLTATRVYPNAQVCYSYGDCTHSGTDVPSANPSNMLDMKYCSVPGTTYARVLPSDTAKHNLLASLYSPLLGIAPGLSRSHSPSASIAHSTKTHERTATAAKERTMSKEPTRSRTLPPTPTNTSTATATNSSTLTATSTSTATQTNSSTVTMTSTTATATPSATTTSTNTTTTTTTATSTSTATTGTATATRTSQDNVTTTATITNTPTPSTTLTITATTSPTNTPTNASTSTPPTSAAAPSSDPMPPPAPALNSLQVALIAVAAAVFLVALVALLLWRRRQRLGRRQGSTSFGPGSGNLNAATAEEHYRVLLNGDGYTIKRQIGKGGFGEVFEAAPPNDASASVALKIIPFEKQSQAQAAIAEFQLLMKLPSHPHIMPILGAVVSDDPFVVGDGKSGSATAGSVNASGESTRSSRTAQATDEYTALLPKPRSFVTIVMPYYPEGDLRRYVLSFLRKGQRFPVADAARIGAQLCSAVEALHVQNVIHRDIKPENVLLSHGHTCAVLTDFGLAKEADRLQQTLKTKVGSLPFVAPECFSGRYRYTCDIWSLGCVLYAIAAMRVDMSNARMLFNDALKPGFRRDVELELLPYFPPAYVGVILDMLQVQPEKRIALKVAEHTLRTIVAQTGAVA